MRALLLMLWWLQSLLPLPIPLQIQSSLSTLGRRFRSTLEPFSALSRLKFDPTPSFGSSACIAADAMAAIVALPLLTQL
jgi:hypothetical protein